MLWKIAYRFFCLFIYRADCCINASAAYKETTVEIETLKTNFDYVTLGSRVWTASGYTES